MPHIAIAGAGIGGLSAALALAAVGCSVALHDRAETLAETGAGVQLSPNASAVLARLGVLDEVGAVAVAPEEVLIRRARDGSTLGRVPLGAWAEQRYGAPFLLVLRADLQAILLRRVAAEPAIELRLGEGVTGFAEGDRGRVLLTFADPGRPSTTVDALVAADGIRSVLRRQLSGSARDDARSAKRSAWRGLALREAVEAAAAAPRSNLWLGPRAHLVHYPVQAGRQVNVVAVVNESDALAESGDAAFWSAPGDPALLRRRFADWAEPARRIVAAPSSWRRWPLFDRPALTRWSRGAVTLLGDAAHPMLPFLAQGAAQSIEDAAVLAASVASSPHDVASAFAHYESRRRARTARVQAQSRRQATLYHLASPASHVRDAVMRMLGPARLAARYDWLYGEPLPLS